VFEKSIDCKSETQRGRTSSTGNPNHENMGLYPERKIIEVAFTKGQKIIDEFRQGYSRNIYLT
jgi:hypothetical protein